MDDEDIMSETEQEFHESFKPSWGPGATLLYAMRSKVKLSSRQTTAIINDLKGIFVSEGRDVRFAKFAVTPEVRAGRTVVVRNKSKHALITYLAYPRNITQAAN